MLNFEFQGLGQAWDWDNKFSSCLPPNDRKGWADNLFIINRRPFAKIYLFHRRRYLFSSFTKLNIGNICKYFQRFIFFIVGDVCFLLSQSWILDVQFFLFLSISLPNLFVSASFHQANANRLWWKIQKSKTLCSSCLVYSFGSKCLKFLWDLKFQKCLRWVFCESRSVTLSHKLLTSSSSPSNLPELENFQDVQDFPTDALFQTRDLGSLLFLSNQKQILI